jgi:peptide deformylase
VEIDDEVVARVREMTDIMYGKRGVGLAAPQVSWSVQLCVINPTPDNRANELVCVNPVLSDLSGEEVAEEGCLCFPELHGNIPRATRLTCRYYDLAGRRHEVVAEGLLARIFQHEADHLQGRLIIDRMTPASRAAAAARLRELEREFKARRGAAV